MNKTRTVLLIFILIVSQSIVATVTGITALHFMSMKTLPNGMFAGECSVGGMGYADAAQVVEKAYADKFAAGSVNIETLKGVFKIPFSDINAGIDGKSTVDAFRSAKSISRVPMLLAAYFGGEKPVLKPVVRIDEGKLRKKLLEVADSLYIAPINAAVGYKDGIIVKKSEVEGVSLDVGRAAELIKMHIADSPWEPVVMKNAGDFGLQAVKAAKKLSDYDDIQQVLSEYSTDILDDALSDDIVLAAKSINGVVLSEADGGGNPDGNPNEFSFLQQLADKGASFEYDSEGYSQVASTLYAALLLAGVPVDHITRTPHVLAPDYIKPGLDAWISENACDLKFVNPFGHKLALFAQVENGRVKVEIAGCTSDKKADYSITTEITQHIIPPIYYTENDRLKPGEKVVLNPGKEGVKVSVYRNDELIGTDKYDAEKSIVQIGPKMSDSGEEK